MLNFPDESDTDYWIDYDQLAPPKAHHHGQESIYSFQSNVEKKDEKITESKWLHSFYQEKMSRVRESKEIEVSESIIKERNNSKKRYTSAIENLESKYKRDMQQAQQDYINFRDLLNKKDQLIRDLIWFIGELGLHFSESTINYYKKEKVVVKDLGDYEYLAKEIPKLQMQVSNLKDICHLYQEDADKANKKSLFYQSEYEKMEKEFRMEIKNMEEKAEQLQKMNEAEKAELVKGFEDRAAEYCKEIVALELIQNRQQEFIIQLQEEIKCAKDVLQNKSMRNKYFDKLKEYKEEMEKIESRKFIPVPPLAENSNSTTRMKGKSSTKSIADQSLSKSFVKRSQSIRSSQNLPVFTRKIYTNRSNCIEIRPQSRTPGL